MLSKKCVHILILFINFCVLESLAINTSDISTNNNAETNSFPASTAMRASNETKNRLIPNASFDEEKVESYEIIQPASIEETINSELLKNFSDPQFAAHKVTLQMNDVDVRDVIAIIGGSIGVNFVIDQDVKGKIESIDLKDYDVGKALRFVCRQLKPPAALVKLGDMWHIMPHEEAKMALVDLPAKELIYAILPVRHANFDEQFGNRVKDAWKSISRGDQASFLHVDEDQKRIHIHAKRDVVAEFKRFVQEIDKPILQVRIDVIIVAARKDFLFEIGFDWSGMYNREQSLSKCPQPFALHGVGGTVLDFPNPLNKTGSTADKPLPIVPNPPNTHNPNLFVNPLNFAFNLFNSGLAFMSGDKDDLMTPGLIRIPFVFGGPDLNYKRLNVILNMAETEEKVSIVSRPSILTSNNKIAKILIGQSIPMQSTTETFSGETKVGEVSSISYKDTGIVLEVRPLVNPDKKSVYLNILVEESIVEGGTTRTNEKGIMTDPPIISVIKTKNEVVLRSGQTTIIGGLSTKENSTTKRVVPFLSRLPIVGELFKAQYEQNRERERYIFITPKIVEYEA